MKKNWIGFWSEFGVYIATVIGVLYSQYFVIIMKTGNLSGIVFMFPHLGEIINSCLVAGLVTHAMEQNSDPDGKILRIRRRLFNSFTNGVLWFSFIQTLIKG